MLNLLDLGLRKVKQKTPAPQINSFHQTPQLEKHKDQKEITATPQVEILFTTLKKHQHHNTTNPNVPLSEEDSSSQNDKLWKRSEVSSVNTEVEKRRWQGSDQRM